MALVPHKITALAESDADGTSGKNIVAGAVVSLFDDQGGVITLYDDESGTNPSTSKTTDSNGQVVVWVTPGEYDEEVNGSLLRRITIGGNSPIEVDTFANLEALRPAKTGQAFICQERGGARYILQPSGYVAKFGDAVFDNGRAAELQFDNECYIRWFGAPGDASGQSTQIQGAVDRLATLGGGKLIFNNGRYGLTSTLVIPKDANISLIGERVSKDSSLSANPDEAGVEIYSVNVIDDLIRWDGEDSVTVSASQLGRGLYIRDINLNGNNKTQYLIDCLNTDLLDVETCRLTGSANCIRSQFNGTYTSALLAGGLRLRNNTFGATSGSHIIMDGNTQNWINGNWFAGTGASVDIVIGRSNKVNIIDNEFNNASSAVFQLTDGAGSEATQDIIINSNKIALSDGTPVIFDDQRTLTASKRITFVGNTVVNGAGIDPLSLHNPDSNVFSYSQTSRSKIYASQTQCDESLINDEAGVAKLQKFQTDNVLRFQHGVNSNAESGSNAGSDYTIQRFDDAGELLGTEFTIDRNTGRVHYKNGSATGNNATIDATTGQLATSSLTTPASGETTVTFNNPRVNFTPVICQMRSYSGTGDPIISKVTTDAGTFSVTIKNLSTSAALNSAVNLMFHAL